MDAMEEPQAQNDQQMQDAQMGQQPFADYSRTQPTRDLVAHELQDFLENISAAVAQVADQVATHLRDVVGVTTNWGVARLTVAQLVSAGLTEMAAGDVVDTIALYTPAPAPQMPIPNVPPPVYVMPQAGGAAPPRRTPLEEAKAKQIARPIAHLDIPAGMAHIDPVEYVQWKNAVRLKMHGLDLNTTAEIDNIAAMREHVIDPTLIGTLPDQFLLAEIEHSVTGKVGVMIEQVSRDHFSGLMAYQDIRRSLASFTSEELRRATSDMVLCRNLTKPTCYGELLPCYNAWATNIETFRAAYGECEPESEFESLLSLLASPQLADIRSLAQSFFYPTKTKHTMKLTKAEVLSKAKAFRNARIPKAKETTSLRSRNQQSAKPAKFEQGASALIPEGKCRDFFRSGNCRFGANCKYSHTRDSTSTPKGKGGKGGKGGEAYSAEQVDPRDEYIQQLEGVLEAKRAARAELYLAKVKFGPKMLKPQRTKAPSFDEQAKLRQLQVPLAGNRAKVVADSAANRHVLGRHDKTYAKTITDLPESKFTTLSGVGGNPEKITQTATMQKGDIELKDMLVSNQSPTTLASIPMLNEQDYTAVLGKKAAGLIKDDKVTELVKIKKGDSHMWGLPDSSSSEPGHAAEMQLAEAKVRKVQQTRREKEMIRHKKQAHTPKAPKGECEVCDAANLEESPSVNTADDVMPTGTETGYVVSYDLLGPVEPDIAGNQYAFICVEAEGGRGYTRLSKTKAGLQAALAEVLLLIQQGRPADDARPIQFKPVHRAHSDGGSGFKADFQQHLKDKGIWCTDTGGYSSNKNARAESRIKKLTYKVRPMLMEATGGSEGYTDLWGPAIMHAQDLTNELPERGWKSPNEKSGRGKPIDIDKLHVFGALTRVLIPKKKRAKGTKFHPTSKMAIWVGRSEQTLGAHKVIPIWWNTKKKCWVFEDVTESSTVRVDDTVFPLQRVPCKQGSAKDFNTFVDQFSMEAEGHDVYVVEKIVNHRKRGNRMEYEIKWQHYRSSENTWEPLSHLKDYGATDMLEEYLNKISPKRAMAHLSEADTDDDRAARYLIQRYKLTWTEAESKTAYITERNKMAKSLELVTGKEKQEVLKSRRYTMMRMNPEEKKDGRRTYRWIVMGNTQPDSLNPDGTDAPVAHATSNKMVVFGPEPAEHQKDITIMVMDYTGAFTQSNDYPDNDPSRYTAFRPYKGAELEVYRQKTSGYGDKIAARRWFMTAAPHLKSLGYKQGENDPCVFNNKKTGVTVYIRQALHVDDLIAKGRTAELQQLEQQLRDRFEMRRAHYLTPETPITHLSQKIEMGWDDDGKWYSISQQDDIENFVKENNIVAAQHVVSPMPHKQHLYKESPVLSKQLATQYRSNLMSCMHFAKCTRYDILHPLIRLSSVMATPTAAAAKDLRRVMAYLATNLSLKIKAHVRETDEFEALSDSDHAGDRGLHSKSTTGVIIFYNGAPIEWISKRQTSTSLSSAEAEIYALSEAVKRMRAVAWRAEELGSEVNRPVVIKMDNEAGKSFQNNTNPNTRLLGCFDLREQWVKELRDKQQVKVLKVPTKYNVSDLFTKCHPDKRFLELLELISERGRVH